jgi:hypothetical protein
MYRLLVPVVAERATIPKLPMGRRRRTTTRRTRTRTRRTRRRRTRRTRTRTRRRRTRRRRRRRRRRRSHPTIILKHCQLICNSNSVFSLPLNVCVTVYTCAVKDVS